MQMAKLVENILALRCQQPLMKSDDEFVGEQNKVQVK